MSKRRSFFEQPDRISYDISPRTVRLARAFLRRMNRRQMAKPGQFGWICRSVPKPGQPRHGRPSFAYRDKADALLIACANGAMGSECIVERIRVGERNYDSFCDAREDFHSDG